MVFAEYVSVPYPFWLKFQDHCSVPHMGPDGSLTSALAALLVSIGGNALLALRECSDSGCDKAAKLSHVVVPSCAQQPLVSNVDWSLHMAFFAGGGILGVLVCGLLFTCTYLCAHRRVPTLAPHVPPPPVRLRAERLASFPAPPLRLVDAGTL